MDPTSPRIKFQFRSEEIDFFLRQGVDLREVRSLVEYLGLLERYALAQEDDFAHTRVGSPIRVEPSRGQGGF